MNAPLPPTAKRDPLDFLPSIEGAISQSAAFQSAQALCPMPRWNDATKGVGISTDGLSRSDSALVYCAAAIRAARLNGALVIHNRGFIKAWLERMEKLVQAVDAELVAVDEAGFDAADKRIAEMDAGVGK